MGRFSINNVAIKGIAAAVPKSVESNENLDNMSEKDIKMLIKTTGVKYRRVAPSGLTTSDLCVEATNKLLEELNWNRSEVDILVFLSQSRDYYLPATSIILQDRLGLSKSTLAFDIGLGCSGFIYGLSVVAGLMSSTGLKRALFMVGDISSATCNPKDNSTYPLFGDGAAVTALEYSADEDENLLQFDLNSDGSGHEAIIIPHGGIRNLVSKESFTEKEIAKGIVRHNLNLALSGIDVFNFSIGPVPKSIRSFLEYMNADESTFDYFLMHQANMLMNETIRKKLKFSTEKVPYSLGKYGNTSSASIPITMVSELRQELTNKKLHLLLAGFGVGLSWGTMALTTNKIIVPELLEV